MALLDSQTGGILKKKPLPGVSGVPALATPAVPQSLAPKPATSEDYFQAAVGDPIFKQTQGDIAADRSNFDQIRRGAIQNAVGVLGFVPDGFNDQYGDIDEATRALAAKNTQAGTSTIARLKAAHEKAVRDSIRANAARGILRSGDTGYQLGQRELENRQNLSDTVSKFLEYLQTGVYGPYAQALAGLNQQEREALMKVYEAIQANGLLSGPVGGSATPPAPGDVQTTLNPYLQFGNTYAQPGDVPTTLNPFLQFGNTSAPPPAAPAPKPKKKTTGAQNLGRGDRG